MTTTGRGRTKERAPGGTLTATLPATGSYTVLVDPFNAATGTATVALT